MLFKETGRAELPTIILIHGGGLSWWSVRAAAERLKDEYHIITPIIDGHGEDGNETFVSIEDSAEKLIDFIDRKCGGRVFAVGGLSIGAQIVVEVLSRRENRARCAVIESALVYPIKTRALSAPLIKASYGLIKKRWFSEMQAKSLYVPKELFERYYADSMRMSKESLINISNSNGSYTVKKGLAMARTKALVIVGENELGVMKRSADALHETIRESELLIAPKMGHGEYSLAHPDEYAETVRAFLSKWA